MKFRKLACLLVAGVAALSLAACGGTPSKGGTGAIKNAQDVFGMGAVTTVQLLGSSFSTSAVQSLAAVALLDESANSEAPKENETLPDEQELPADGNNGTTPEGATPDSGATGGETTLDATAPDKETVQQFHKYFEMLDTMLGDSVVGTVVTENTDANYSDYALRMEISGATLDGKKVTHVMYYNETAGEQSKEGEDEEKIEAGAAEENQGEPVEAQAEYRLDGVLVMNGKDYAMKGERKTETDGKETEDEIAVRAYPDAADKTTYVEVKQETETEAGETETEYVYRIYDAGKLIEETAVAFEAEVEAGETETEIQIEFRKGEGKGSYKLSKAVEGTTVEIEVEYLLDGKTGKFEIKQKKNTDGVTVYEYEFADGTDMELENDDD